MVGVLVTAELVKGTVGAEVSKQISAYQVFRMLTSHLAVNHAAHYTTTPPMHKERMNSIKKFMVKTNIKHKKDIVTCQITNQ